MTDLLDRYLSCPLPVAELAAQAGVTLADLAPLDAALPGEPLRLHPDVEHRLSTVLGEPRPKPNIPKPTQPPTLQMRFMRVIRERPGITGRELADILDVQPKRAFDLLGHIRKSGLVSSAQEITYNGKRLCWRLTKTGKRALREDEHE